MKLKPKKMTKSHIGNKDVDLPQNVCKINIEHHIQGNRLGQNRF